MKLELILTIIGSAVFIAVMFVWKETLKAGIDAYGWWIGIPIVAFFIGLGYWIDSRRKPPIDQ
ncbi:hypothetical protein [Afipia carboxidovorans]|uniref:hypothetical protein n=1 Tax=Afipia carboxidovorans TaxID=40137 RepID=UPI003090B296|nr:hypothetical protein CRBSH125_35410 [Afipia carboxidovorans]